MKKPHVRALLPRLLLLLCAAALASAPLSAQAVRVEGDVDHPANRLLREILDRENHLLIERDTVLGPEFHTAGDLLIVGADVRLAGRVDGSVAVVRGVLFTRPGSVIAGEIASLGGEVYLSRLAEAGEVHDLPPVVATRLVRGAGAGTPATLIMVPPPLPKRVGTTGVFGFAVPTYDRVSGLTLRWGSQLLLRRDTVPPVVRGSVSWATARGAPGASLTLELPTGGSGYFTAELARESFTNEDWLRGSLMNTLAALTLRSDLRDYHESDVAWVGWERRPRQALVAGESFLGPRVVVRASRDRSLRERNVWSVLNRGEPWRVNPPIDEGVLVSATAGAVLDWRGRSSRFLGDGGLEWAPGFAGDFEFAQLVVQGRYEMAALWNHEITLRGRTQHTLGDSPAPRQRWSFVGGANTLPTLPVAAQRGDQLVFLETAYDVPLRWLRVRYLGSPDLRVAHATGAAWPNGTPMPAWEQNVGVGLRFFLLEAMVWLDPREPRSPSFSLGTGFHF
jgi:hypothetical protein